MNKVEVIDSTGGFTVVALEKIEPGECIICEAPLVAFDAKTPKHLFMKFIDTLPETKQKVFAQLGSNFQRYPLHGHMLGVFPIISRLSHRCDRNCIVAWRLNDAKGVLIAVRPIFQGETVGVSAIDPLLTFKERIFILNRLRLKCRCALCFSKNSGRDTTVLQVRALCKIVSGLRSQTTKTDGPDNVLSLLNDILLRLWMLHVPEPSSWILSVGFRVCFDDSDFVAAYRWAVTALEAFIPGSDGKWYASLKHCVRMATKLQKTSLHPATPRLRLPFSPIRPLEKS